MMREPWFWRSHSITARAISTILAPAALIYDLGQQARWRLTRPYAPNIPVICIGNASLGGVGKTPFAIALHKLFAEKGLKSHFLSRGYGGAHPGPLRVDASKHNADDVGDEALLLSRYAPVWIARNRPDGAKAAADGNADVIIMDDGFQNPKVKKTVSILLLDAQDPRGNGCIFPAGPLREPVARAQSRADITVAVDADAAAGNAAKHLASRFSAWLEPVNTPPAQTVAAFSGIGKPDKFFDALRRKGFTVAETISFPDHHPFTQSNLAALTQTAARTKAQLITTEKDFVRLPNTFKENVLTFPVEMKFNAPTQLIDLILEAIDRRRSLQ